MESSSTRVKHDLGDTGGVYSDDSDVVGQPVDLAACDACPGCDDFCESKLCERCDQKRRVLAQRDASCPYGYTKCQVRRHNRQEDCWLVAHRKVYDATKFIGQHPAGPTPILKRAGTDVSVDYDFHSPYSQKTFWKPLCIGRLVHCPVKDGPPPAACTIQ